MITFWKTKKLRELAKIKIARRGFSHYTIFFLRGFPFIRRNLPEVFVCVGNRSYNLVRRFGDGFAQCLLEAYKRKKQFFSSLTDEINQIILSQVRKYQGIIALNPAHERPSHWRILHWGWGS